MKGSTLKRLGVVGEAAKNDVSSGSATLAPTEAGTLALYRGTHGACGVLVSEAGLEKAISVDASELQSLSHLFEDNADLKVIAQDTKVEIRAGRRKIALRYIGDPDIEMYEPMISVATHATVNLGELRRLLRAASLVPIATIANPILTGIRLIAKGSLLGVQASNGTSFVYEAFLRTAVVTSPIDAVIPSTEVSYVLAILGGSDKDDVKLSKDERALTLWTDEAVVRVPTLQGDWPSLSAFTSHFKKDADSFTLPVETIRHLATAANIYGAGEVVEIEPADDGIMIRTTDAGKGSFEEFLVGSLSQPYKLWVPDLELSARLFDTEITFGIGYPVVGASSKDAKVYMLVRL